MPTAASEILNSISMAHKGAEASERDGISIPAAGMFIHLSLYLSGMKRHSKTYVEEC